MDIIKESSTSYILMSLVLTMIDFLEEIFPRAMMTD